MPTGSTGWFASEGPRDAELTRNGELWRGRLLANDLFDPRLYIWLPDELSENAFRE